MKRNDIWLMAGIFFTALLIFACCHLLYPQNGDLVEVAVDGGISQTFPLHTDRSYMIPSKGGKNLLEIKDGFASITMADCPDRLCVHQKKISRQGETLVCLPHKVVVSVISSKKAILDEVAQ